MYPKITKIQFILCLITQKIHVHTQSKETDLSSYVDDLFSKFNLVQLLTHSEETKICKNDSHKLSFNKSNKWLLQSQTLSEVDKLKTHVINAKSQSICAQHQITGIIENNYPKPTLRDSVLKSI